LEIYVGLICACLPAFLPFFEYVFPNGLSLGSYFSRFSSLLSRNRGSTENSKSPAVPSHGAIMVNSDYNVVVKGDYAQLEEGGGVTGYREMGDRTRLAEDNAHGGEVDGIRGGHRFSNMATRGKIAESGFPMKDLK